jgi:pheromone shutdown-related protein TraB
MEYENSYKNMKLVGTSHIAKASIERINAVFDSFKPDIICVELDRKRLHALLTDQKPDYSISGIRRYGLQGYLFAVIGGLIQRKLGNVVGIKPGSDMLAAVKISMEHKKELSLVDQDIEITLRKFSKKFSFKEKFRLIWDIIKSPFSKKMSFDLNNVPASEIIEKLMKQMKDRYPNLYFVLVEERNQIMAKNIYNIMSKNPEKKIMAVIGAGHEKEMLKLIKQEDYKRDKVY